MAPIAAPMQQDQRFVFHDVPWQTYFGLLKSRSEGVIRLTYHRGVLEIMTVSQLHERLSAMLHNLVKILTQEHGMEVASVGSTTMHAEQLDLGGEADQSYYIRHEEIVREFGATMVSVLFSNRLATTANVIPSSAASLFQPCKVARWRSS